MADPLTTPIATTATQYRLDSINLDVQGQTVTIQVSLLDAVGAVTKTVTFTDTWATVGIPAVSAAALKGLVVAYMKTKGTVN